MKTIWKYMLRLDDVQVIEMPKDAKILDVQIQMGIPCLWALVDSGQPKIKRYFVIQGTGQEMDPRAFNYVGSFQMNGGMMVYHLFELP